VRAGFLTRDGRAKNSAARSITKARWVSGISAVAIKPSASSVQRPDEVEFFDSSGSHKVESLELDKFREVSRRPVYGTRPFYYNFLESERILLFAPAPDTAAHTTLLDGALTAGATSATVDDTSNFPDQGRIIVDSEVIAYTAKTSTTFTGLSRGVEGTTAASHSDDATVTERDLFLYSERAYQDREMRTYYTTGTATFTKASATVTGSGTAWEDMVAVGDYIGYTSNATTVDPLRWYEITAIASDTSLTIGQNFTEDTQSGSAYIVSDPNPFPAYLDPVIKAFAISGLLKKMGDFERSRAEWLTVERFVNNAKKNRLHSDSLLVSGSMRTRTGRRLPIWVDDVRVT